MVKENLLHSRPHVKCYSSQPFVIPIRSKIVVVCDFVSMCRCVFTAPLECVPHYLLYKVPHLYFFLHTINLCVHLVSFYVSLCIRSLYMSVFICTYDCGPVWVSTALLECFPMWNLPHTANLWCFHQVKNYTWQKGSLLATLRQYTSSIGTTQFTP